MVILETQTNRRAVQTLPFCYLCGGNFVPLDETDRDHLPPKTIFHTDHRDPLILPTHKACNNAHNLTDEMMGQLLAPQSGRIPSDPKDVRLKLKKVGGSPAIDAGDLNIKEAIWRWISGFHAALYREPAVRIGIDTFGTLETPFPIGSIVDGKIVMEDIKPQHSKFVEAIKGNRENGNLDKIICNRDKFTYECFWVKSDNDEAWMCIFALNIYDWKDLGPQSADTARGCAGLYVLPSGGIPANATREIRDATPVVNNDPLDPFAA